MAIETPIETPGSGALHEGLIPPLPEGAAGSPALNAPVDIHPALQEVQRMKEFAPHEPGWLDELMKQPFFKELADKMQHALESALDALRGLFSNIRLPAGNHMPDHLVSLFSGITGFLIGLLALYSFYLLLSYLVRVQKRQAQKESRPLGQLFDNALLINTRHHQEQARQLAADGQHAPAIRQLYFAVLCLLDENGILPFEKTRTNFEYGQALANLAGVTMQRGFRQLAGTFEASRYGAQPMGAIEYEACQQHYAQLAETSSAFTKARKASPQQEDVING